VIYREDKNLKGKFSESRCQIFETILIRIPEQALVSNLWNGFFKKL